MNDKIILEVGCHDGHHTKKISRTFGNLPYYGFEPVPYLFTKLTEMFKENKNIKLTHAAIDIEDGIKDFHISNPVLYPYGCSSLHEFSDDIHEKWKNRPDFKHIETIKIKTIRLETFLDEIGFNGEIVYLHCDAQGNDVKVLKSLGKYLKNVKAGVIEVGSKVQLYKNTDDNNFEYAKNFLLSNGFFIENHTDLNREEVDIHFKSLENEKF
jgi:FkbM family methyltransferase